MLVTVPALPLVFPVTFPVRLPTNVLWSRLSASSQNKFALSCANTPEGPAKITEPGVNPPFVVRAPIAPGNVFSPSCPVRPGGPGRPIAPVLPFNPGIRIRSDSVSTMDVRGKAPTILLKFRRADVGTLLAVDAAILAPRNALNSVSNIVSISSTPLGVRGQEIRYCWGRRGAICLDGRQTTADGNYKSRTITVKSDEKIRAIQTETSGIEVKVIIGCDHFALHQIFAIRGVARCANTNICSDRACRNISNMNMINDGIDQG